MILSQEITPSQALRSAKALLGSYGNLKPGDPEEFAKAIAIVLASYPPGVVEECVSPRSGVARKVEFLSIRSLTEWLDNRLEFYQALAKREDREAAAPTAPDPVFSDEHCSEMKLGMLGVATCISTGRPIDPLSLEQLVEIGRQAQKDGRK